MPPPDPLPPLQKLGLTVESWTSCTKDLALSFLSPSCPPKMRWPSFHLRPLSPPMFWTTLSLERCSKGGVIAQCIIQIGTLREMKYGLWENQLDAVTMGACEDCPRKLGYGHPARRDLFPFCAYSLISE